MQQILKLLQTYKLKQVARNCSNFYFSERENQKYERKETVAEHIYSCIKLADFMLTSENEFKDLDKLKIYELLMYHDDIEIITEEICISDREKRKTKEQNELINIKKLSKLYPRNIDKKFINMDYEFRKKETKESLFANAIDKLDALIHELNYPNDWKDKGFTKENIISRFGPSFEHSETFKLYFHKILIYLEENNYI